MLTGQIFPILQITKSLHSYIPKLTHKQHLTLENICIPNSSFYFTAFFCLTSFLLLPCFTEQYSFIHLNGQSIPPHPKVFGYQGHLIFPLHISCCVGDKLCQEKPFEMLKCRGWEKANFPFAIKVSRFGKELVFLSALFSYPKRKSAITAKSGCYSELTYFRLG